ncbi:phage tail family protein [Neobacillus niacini]|uniref:phage tail family protein n=1 Tax=Neobacillus niacini TaxID=86668 RepID=UPI0030002033
MNTIIQRLDGTEYDLEELGIITRDFVVSSLAPRHYFEVIQGRHGAVDLGTEYDVRTINASFYQKAVDSEEYASKRHDAFRIFRSNEPFYVIESRNPNKRWLVKVATPFQPDQRQLYGFFDVEFTAINPFAESIFTTLDPSANAAQITGLGSRAVNYKHTTATFEILNDGDIEIDPRAVPFAITFTGASTNLKIKNLTTGDVWQYTGNSAGSDKVVLNGIRATKNGLSVFRDTNRKLITLAPGWNAFEVTGATSPFEISFDFRYYTI